MARPCLLLQVPALSVYNRDGAREDLNGMDALQMYLEECFYCHGTCRKRSVHTLALLRSPGHFALSHVIVFNALYSLPRRCPWRDFYALSGEVWVWDYLVYYIAHLDLQTQPKS